MTLFLSKPLQVEKQLENEKCQTHNLLGTQTGKDNKFKTRNVACFQGTAGIARDLRMFLKRDSKSVTFKRWLE